MLPPVNRIREVRKAQRVTQAALATRLNMTQAHLSHVECGRRNLTFAWARRVAAALGVSMADLLVDADNPDRLAADEREVVQAMRRASELSRQNIVLMAVAVSPNGKD